MNEPARPGPAQPSVEEHPAIKTLKGAPLDDEPETEEERTGVEEARRDVEAGRLVPHDVVRKRWLEEP
jgi:hypothetical protein